MQKCKEFFKRNWKTCIAVCTIIVLILVFAFIYLERISDKYIKNITVSLYTQQSDEHLTDVEKNLNDGDIVKQQISLKHGLFYGINLKFNVLGNDSTGEVRVTLKNDNIDENWNLKVKDINKEGLTFLAFKEPLHLEKAPQAELTVTTADTDGADLSLMMFRTDKMRDGWKGAMLNGTQLDMQTSASLEGNSRRIYNIPFIIFCIVSVLLLVFIFVFLRKSKFKDKLPLVCAVIFVCFGIFYSMVFTPTSVPDEQRHYISALSTSNKLMFDFSDGDNGTNMRSEESTFFTNANNILSPDEYNKLYSDFSLFAKSSEKTHRPEPPLGGKDISYLVPAIGITLARLLNLSAMMTFYLGRLFNILFLAVCLYFSMKKMPFGKIVPFIVFMLPMTLHLAASLSYDVFTIGFCMLLVSQILYMIYKKGRIKWSEIVFALVVSALVIPQKVVYFWLAFLIFFVPKEKFASKAQKIVAKTAVPLVGIIGILLLQLESIFSSSYNDTLGITTYSISYILTHPIKDIAMIARTTGSMGTYYYETMIGKLLGWFQIPIPTIFIYAFTILIVISFIRKEDEPKPFSVPRRGLFLILFLLIYATVLACFMHDFTEVGTYIINGVQGRYFIPAVPLLYFAFRSNRITAGRSVDNYLVFGTTLLSSMTILTYFLEIIHI